MLILTILPFTRLRIAKSSWGLWGRCPRLGDNPASLPLSLVSWKTRVSPSPAWEEFGKPFPAPCLILATLFLCLRLGQKGRGCGPGCLLAAPLGNPAAFPAIQREEKKSSGLPKSGCWMLSRKPPGLKAAPGTWLLIAPDYRCERFGVGSWPCLTLVLFSPLQCSLFNFELLVPDGRAFWESLELRFLRS